jgi:phenylpropionate dioxygenase-like ring-hydroxylating dioxygenase large terminal subunit
VAALWIYTLSGGNVIRDQWYVVLQSNELKKGKPIGVTRMGEKMVFWRDSKGNPVCQADICPHRGVAISLGCINEDRIMCPFHGFEYDQTGKCVLIPANGKASQPPQAFKVIAYPSREVHGYIYIWWGDERSEYPEIPWFEDLDSSFTTSQMKDHWTVHYSRAIENQLDVFHIPFVHPNTIGRGNRTVSDGPLTVFNKDTLEIWVYSHVDDGITKAKRSSEIPAPSRPPFLKFRFPHLWMNRISNDLRITVFFTPIDEENCIIYLRNYQRFVKFPVLRTLVAEMLNPVNKYILYQDKRVVLSQRPKKSGLRIGEKLIPADKPIIEYRTIREELQKSASMEVD